MFTSASYFLINLLVGTASLVETKGLKSRKHATRPLCSLSSLSLENHMRGGCTLCPEECTHSSQLTVAQALNNSIFQTDTLFHIPWDERSRPLGDRWKVVMGKESNRFLFYHLMYTHGQEFLNKLSSKQWEQLIAQLETPRYSKDYIPFIQCFHALSSHKPVDRNSCRTLRVKQEDQVAAEHKLIIPLSEWITSLNRYGERKLGFDGGLDQTTFLVQNKLQRSLHELDFENALKEIKSLFLHFNQSQRTLLWKRMQDVKGFRHPLHMAVVMKGDLGYLFVKLFLKSGANVNQKDHIGRTPLIVAASQDNVILTEFLLTQGACVDCTDQYGFSALHYASEKAYSRTVARLVLYGADPQRCAAPRFKGETPIHLAVKDPFVGSYETVRTLIRYTGFPTMENCRNVQQKAESPYVSVVVTKQADVLRLLLTPSFLNSYIYWQPHTLSHRHLLFHMTDKRFPEKTILPVLEIEMQQHNANLLCATTDEKGHTLFWWGCKLAYPHMLHRLLDFFKEASLHKYPGYTMCDPHKLDNRGYAPIELLVTHMIQHTWEEPELSSTARRILRFRGNGGTAFLNQALSGENTMRKAATVTFASTTFSREIVFNPPLTMSLDDLFLSVPTTMRVEDGRDFTPFLVSLLNHRRRGQRLLMKAMLVSYESNVNTFRLLTELWKGIVDAADLHETSTLTLTSKNYPFLIQDILSLISPHETRTEQSLVELVHLVPSNFLFQSHGVGPLENAVWMSLSPLSSKDMLLFRALTSERHIHSSTSEDCRAALYAIHQASLYFRRFRFHPLVWDTFQYKKQTMIRILFSSPILDIHDELLFISHLTATFFILVSFLFFLFFFLTTRVPSIAFQYVDPAISLPQSAMSLSEAFWIASRQCLLGNNSSLHLWSPFSFRLHRLWMCLRLVTYLYVFTCRFFWHSKEVYQWPSFLLALVWIQSFFICYTIPPKAQRLLLSNLDYFNVLSMTCDPECSERKTVSPHTSLNFISKHRQSFPGLLKKKGTPWTRYLKKIYSFPSLYEGSSRHGLPGNSRSVNCYSSSCTHPRDSRKAANTNSSEGLSEHGLPEPSYSFLAESLQQQSKISPLDYFRFLYIIFGLVIVSSLAPFFGATFLCNFMPIYHDTDLFEAYRSTPFSAFLFESALVLTTTTLLFRFFKPFLMVLIVIQQRLRVLHLLSDNSPLQEQKKHHGPSDLHGADLWEKTTKWTHLWRDVLAESESVWNYAKMILNFFAVFCVVFMAGFLRIFVSSSGGELLQTRLGLGLLQLVSINMLLVTLCAKRACLHNKTLTESWEFIQTLYISSRFGTLQHSILRHELIDLLCMDSKAMQLLGIYVSESYHRLLQLVTIPAILLLLLTSVYNKAPYMYL